MRFLNKYKLHENPASADWKLPKRVFNFKRPKWGKIKNKLRIRRFKWENNRKIWLLPVYANHTKVSIRRRYYAKKFFKVKQQAKKYLKSLFENSVKFNKKKLYKDRNSAISSYIIKPIFRIDLLLWYLFFFNSSVEARNFINEKNVLINNKIVRSNYELKKGDIISFNLNPDYAEKNKYKVIKKKYKKTRKFFTFLEYDYYTNNIVVLKNWNELSKDELSLTIKSAKKFKYV